MALSRKYDRWFQRYGERCGLPVAFLRALAYGESRLNPDLVHHRSRATGLLQITWVVVSDINQRLGLNHSLRDMLDPETNILYATRTLCVVKTVYERHADVPNLRIDWRNPRFVELFVMGWNSGYSDAGGVGRVVSYLKRTGNVPAHAITIDVIQKYAQEAGATRHLTTRSTAWAKGVTRNYFRELGHAVSPSPALPVPTAPAPVSANVGSDGWDVATVAWSAALAYFVRQTLK